ncbi:AAA family ATPase [Thioalkalivibrio sp. ALgr3]|uniref:AAA family ATPase n=1 Tax=Thioalkalivibrio sp. ALgr3 TaxID=1239292 RepID=UPI0003604133|nr:AAA family ATPase [Thioalkalivibrio sp. ALgr3]
MNFKQVALENFRHVQSLEVSLHERLTVLVAPNGQGKTTLLDALAVLMGPFVGAFDMGKRHGRHILHSDARYRGQAELAELEQQYPVRIHAHMSGLGEHDAEASILRELTGPGSRTTIKGAAPLASYGSDLMAQVRAFEPVTLPLVSYYGTGRLWKTHKNLKHKAVLSASRTLGYEDCLTSASNYFQLQEWVGKATMAVFQGHSRGDGNMERLRDQLGAVAEAVDRVMEPQGWSEFHYSLMHEELAMQQKGQGTLPLSLLSDGVRTMVSMVADMAWRCAKLNPHLGRDAAARTPGVVLIDEVDLHLHPEWQQQVVQSLRAAFPLVQFIVTTHSPQVLTTVPRECIRQLGTEWDDEQQTWKATATEPDFQTEGVASPDTLARIMGIDPVPDVVPARKLAAYRQAIEEGRQDTPEARALRDELLGHFGEQHPEMLECERLQRFQEMKRRMKAKGTGPDA